RQDVQLAVLRHAQTDRVAELFGRHPDDADVAEVEHLACLQAPHAVEFPSTDQRIEERAGAAAPPAVAAERQIVDPVPLHGVLDAADLPGLEDLSGRPGEPVALEDVRLAPRVA